MEALGQEYFPHENYGKEWAIVALLAGLLGWVLWITYHPRPLPAPVPLAARSAGYDWFLVVHLPEIARDPLKTEQAQARYSRWLGALVRSGYHPLLLTDVARRLQEGEGLPEKTVVLVFDPAYYHTYEALAPVFQQYRVPAVWLTDRTALARGDKHYVNRYIAHSMTHSGGFWDVGYFGEGFWTRNQTSSSRVIKIGNTLEAQWAVGAGQNALNWSNAFASLNRLDVSPKWTEDDLLDRLGLETPIQGTVHLGVKPVQNRLWGIVATSPHQDSRFNFRAPLSETSANIYWLSTRNIPDATVDLNIPSYFGEFFLLLRSDTKSGEGIGVGFGNGRLRVDEYLHGTRRGLKEVAWAGNSRPIAAHVVLAGDDLTVAGPGVEPFKVHLLPLPLSHQGMARISVYDRIRGAARADAVDIAFTPLIQSSTTGQPNKTK